MVKKNTKRKSSSDRQKKHTKRQKGTFAATDNVLSNQVDTSHPQREVRLSFRQQAAPIVIALAIFAIASLAIMEEFVLSIVGLIIASISILGVFSPKTPLGQFIYRNNSLNDEQVDAFFTAYQKGLLHLILIVGLIAIYLFFAFLDFFRTHSFFISISYIYIFTEIVVLALILRQRRIVRDALKAMSWFVVIIIIIFGSGNICSRLINMGKLDSAFAYVKPHAVIDIFLIQTSTMQNYQNLYEKYYALIARANKFLMQQEESREDFDLWGPITWSSKKAKYVLQDTSLSTLKNDGLSPDVVEKLTRLRNESFTGDQELLNNVSSIIGSDATARYKDQLLKATISSKQKIRENQFKEAWRDTIIQLDQEIIATIKDQINRAIELGRFRKTLFPSELQPLFVASALIEENVNDFSSLATTSKVLILNMFLILRDRAKIIVISVISLTSIFICYIVSLRLKKYNYKYDPNYIGSNYLFFTVMTFIGFFLAIFPLVF